MATTKKKNDSQDDNDAIMAKIMANPDRPKSAREIREAAAKKSNAKGKK